MKVYLSGPMTGLPDYNRPEFNRVAAILRDMGHEVFNPAEAEQPILYRVALASGLMWICEEADGIVSLRGSADSPGARAEIEVAAACEIPRWVQIVRGVGERVLPVGSNTQELEAALFFHKEPI